MRLSSTPESSQTPSPRNDPTVCDYRRFVPTSRSGVFAQNEHSFWISDHPPLLSESHAFRNSAPAPTRSDSADVNIADRTVPTRMIRYNASKRPFSALVADSIATLLQRFVLTWLPTFSFHPKHQVCFSLSPRDDLSALKPPKPPGESVGYAESSLGQESARN
jgi:hypothetical protein